MTGIDRATAAHYVLRAVGEPGSWMAPGSFYEALVLACIRADSGNLELLGLGFPELADVVGHWRLHGPADLLRWAGEA